MKTKILTLNEKTMAMICLAISTSPLDGSLQVIIRKAKDKRSIAANNLYWAWIKELSNQTGYTEDELHSKFKRTYLPRIYMEDAQNQNQVEWTALFDIIKEDGTPLMIERALDTVSSTWLTVQQFTEYLHLIEAFCQSKSLMLPADPELYKQAMH